MNPKSATVLIMDDDPVLSELIACFLASAQIRAVMVMNGLTGVQQAHTLLPSLILCDSCMPGIDGLQVIEALRSASATAHIPIVLMSGHAAASFDGCGANAFLQKPFHMAEMVALVQRFVRQNILCHEPIA